MSEKPRHRSGYSPEQTDMVRSACLTVAVTLGAYLDDVVIVGGLVPSLLDLQLPVVHDEDSHPGTNDLDLGLSLGLLDGQRYMEISERLRTEGFEPDTNRSGNKTVQRWHLGGLKVDFLIPPATDQDPKLRVQNLESDFGALVTPGLELAFDERIDVEIEGTTLKGEHATRVVPVCGPGAYVVLKALAFADRSEPKDAYDMVYVIRRTTDGATTIAAKLREHADAHPEVVRQAVELLERDFASVEHIGPQRCAEFEHLDPDARNEAAADAHGHIDDLLRAYRA